jgi:hypothetical protein
LIIISRKIIDSMLHAPGLPGHDASSGMADYKKMKNLYQGTIDNGKK